MTRRSKRGDEVGINLFPFLAVLICTVGALIVLLVVVMQKARTTAEQLVSAPAVDVPSEVAANDSPATASGLVEPAPIDSPVREPEPVKNPIDPKGPEKTKTPRSEIWNKIVDRAQTERDGYLWQVEMLSESRNRTIARLQDKRKEVGHLEDHIRRLQGQLSQMQESDTLTSLQSQTTDLTDAVTQLAQRKKQIAETEDQVAKIRELVNNRQQNFMVVPYEGSHGTNRRPFYIECNGDGIVIQPLGIKFSLDEFKPPIGVGPNNPIASALRATREYVYRVYGPEAAEPYPLIIVRPNGTTAYRSCRHALQDWKHDFGYELVDTEISLTYPEVDPELAKIIEQTVGDARARNVKLRQFVASIGEDEYGPVLRAGSRDGGFIRRDGRPASTARRRKRPSPHTATTQPTRVASSKQWNHNSTSPTKGLPSAAARRKSNLATTNQGDAYAIRPPQSASQAANETASLPTTAPGEAIGGSHYPTGETSGESATQQQKASTNQSSRESIASSRGANWALPNASNGAIGITRPLGLCFAGDRLQLNPEGGTAMPPQIFPLHDGVREATLSLVSDIWKRIDEWGSAGPGVYWKPKLDVLVEPGAETQFQAFEALLQGSGLEIKRR